MSYGFYKLPPTATHQDYVRKVASQFHLTEPLLEELVKPNIEPIATVLEPPKVAETMLSIAKQQGYTGNICQQCSGTRMKMAGHCEVCEDCGESSGCS